MNEQFSVSVNFIDLCAITPLELHDPPAFPTKIDHYMGNGNTDTSWDPMTLATNGLSIDCGPRTVTFDFVSTTATAAFEPANFKDMRNPNKFSI